MLLTLNHDSWFCSCDVSVRRLEFIVGFPPADSIWTPSLPSGKVELARTRAAGRSRYGVPTVREALTPRDVSVRMPTPK